MDGSSRLTASESFKVGERDFRLPGLGSYLAAATSGDSAAILAGIFTLVVLIVFLEQVFWRPLSVWAFRFRSDMGSVVSEFLALGCSISYHVLCWSSGLNANLIPISEYINKRGALAARSIKAIDYVAPLKWRHIALFVCGIVMLVVWGSAGLRLLLDLSFAEWREVGNSGTCHLS